MISANLIFLVSSLERDKGPGFEARIIVTCQYVCCETLLCLFTAVTKLTTFMAALVEKENHYGCRYNFRTTRGLLIVRQS